MHTVFFEHVCSFKSITVYYIVCACINVYINNFLSLPPLPPPCLQAGMVEEMNTFASRFMSESEKREEIISEASAAADDHKDPK